MENHSLFIIWPVSSFRNTQLGENLAFCHVISRFKSSMKILITSSQVSLWLPEHPNHRCLSIHSSLLSSVWRINCLLCWVFITSIVNCHKLCIYYFIVLGSQRWKENIIGLIQSVGRVALSSGSWGFVTLPPASLEVTRRFWFVLHFPLSSMQWQSISLTCLLSSHLFLITTQRFSTVVGLGWGPISSLQDL